MKLAKLKTLETVYIYIYISYFYKKRIVGEVALGDI